tara:strand:- start:1366 stop:2919 length:1554 start_codon:yes stop_codon:yes gene_type:complete
MSENFDTNIDNYTDNELLEIIGLNNLATKSVIKKKINIIYNQLLENKEYNLLDFFKNMKNKLLNDENFNEKTNLNSKNEINNYYDQFNIIKEKELTNNLNIPLEIGKGELNPYLRQSNDTMILIDSKDRPLIMPYNDSAYSPSSSTNFTCNLSSTLQNVISIRLSSIFIPKSFTNIDKMYGNNFFEIHDISNNITKSIVISNGNYNLKNLINNINQTLIQNDISDIEFTINYKYYIDSSNNINTHYEDISTNITGYNEYVKITNNSISNSYNIIFYDSTSNTYNSLNTFLSKNYYTNTLGYYLGFRFYDDNINSTIDKIPTNWTINFNPQQFYISQTNSILNNLRYFRLCIDDFQNNQTTSSVVTIQRTENKLTLPSYINKLDLENQQDISYNIYINEDTNEEYIQYVPQYPRKLTINQLQSANNILLEQKTANNRENIFNNQNVLAIININSDFESNSNFISINNIDKESTIIRKYFGPVNIDKLKISLYDNNGFLVNLNGNDWNFILHVKQLYQY